MLLKLVKLGAVPKDDADPEGDVEALPDVKGSGGHAPRVR